MKPAKHTEIRMHELNLAELSWIPADLAASLAAITDFLEECFGSNGSRIGLYGSWQRGDANSESDVDIVVFLKGDVAWFDAMHGIVSLAKAHKDQRRWHAIEQSANKLRRDARVYSIAVVTPAMLDFYEARGPIHLQNWVRALKNSYLIWENWCEFR
jgi:predicted nucleotidyltransferase